MDETWYFGNFVERWEEFLNKMKWSNSLSSLEWRCGLEEIYNLFNNSGRRCDIIEMWGGEVGI